MEQWRRAIIFLSVGSSFILIFGSVMLLPSFLPLWFEERELVKFLRAEEARFQQQKNETNFKTARDLKSKTALVKSYANIPPKFSRLLEDLFYLAGAGIQLKQISINKDRALTVGGMAVNRRFLQNFGENLRRSPQIQEINSSLSDIVRGAESFTIQGQFKNE